MADNTVLQIITDEIHGENSTGNGRQWLNITVLAIKAVLFHYYMCE